MASFRDRIIDRARTALRGDAVAPPPPMPAPVAPATRVDASTSDTSSYSGAAIANALSGLGGARDSGAMARPNMDREYLSDEELITLLRGTVYRRIVSLLPRWSTVKGWYITDDSKEERPLAEAMRRLGVQSVVRRADTWGRAMGESRVLLVTDDPAPLDQPLDRSKVRKLHRLEVLDRREMTPIAYNADLRAGPLGEPLTFRVTPWRPGVALPNQVVHASRLLRFYGDELPPSQEGRASVGTWGWGADAIGQTLWDAIRHMSQTSAGGARLAQELSIAVFKLKAGAAKTSGDQRTEMIAKLQTLNMMKSIANAIFIAVDEAFERVAAAPAGFEALSSAAERQLALLTGIPNALLFGDAPSGLNTDGESWEKGWHSNCAAHAEERYRHPLEVIAEILYHSEQGGVPDEWALHFHPLGQLSEEAKSTIRESVTRADVLAIGEGILTREEARTRYTQPGGFALELQPLAELELAPTPKADPAAEAAARALAEELLAGKEREQPGEDEEETDEEPEEAVPERSDAADGAVWIGVVVPDAAHAAVEGARAAVLAAVGGELQTPTDAPHVTLLYLGEVDAVLVPEVIQVVQAVAERLGPFKVSADRPGTFRPSGASAGKAPVILHVGHSWEMGTLHDALLPRLAHLVRIRQHPTYRPHLTLGYASGLEPEDHGAVAEVEVAPVEWVVGRIEVRHGPEVVATVPLVGRADAARRGPGSRR